MPFDRIAWHAGASSYHFPGEEEPRSGFNRCSIGIELDNAGPLTETPSGYRASFGHVYKRKDTYYAAHKFRGKPGYWHTYSEEQMTTLQELCRLLVDEYPIRYILGHDDIAPSRKTDPGPAFPMESFRNRILNADRDADSPDAADLASGRVTAHALNIRSGPSGEYDIIGPPLKRDTVVRIIERRGGWYLVRREMEGWVSGDYVETD